MCMVSKDTVAAGFLNRDARNFLVDWGLVRVPIYQGVARFATRS